MLASMAVVTVIGAGMMGTALCTPLVDAGHEVRLCGTHLDREIVAYYRATGAGWQTRINEELARVIARSGRGKRAA